MYINYIVKYFFYSMILIRHLLYPQSAFLGAGVSLGITEHWRDRAGGFCEVYPKVGFNSKHSQGQIVGKFTTNGWGPSTEKKEEMKKTITEFVLFILLK